MFITDDRATHSRSSRDNLDKGASLGSAIRFGQVAPWRRAYFQRTARLKVFLNASRALLLDRNLANAHGWIAIGKNFLGRAEETEAHVQEALRLSPRDIFAYRWMMYIGLANVYLKADAEAVIWLRRSIEANRNNALTHFYLAVPLAFLGKLDEALAATRAGLALQSNLHHPPLSARLTEQQSDLSSRTRTLL